MPAPSTDTTSVANDIGSWLGLSGSTLCLGAAFVLVVWACWRTQSTHLVMLRAWRLVYGRKPIGDRHLASFIEGRDRLMFVRLHTGLQVRTLKQARRLLAWAQRNDEEPAYIKACGSYFDLEAMRLAPDKLPGPARLLASVLLLGTAAALVIAFAVASAAPSALLQMKQSGIHLALTERRATKIFGSGSVGRADCETPPPRTAIMDLGFTSSEADSLCVWLLSPDRHGFVEDTVAMQRKLFPACAVMIAWLGWQLFAFLRAATFARAMHRRLQTRIAGRQSAPPPG